MGLHKRLKLSVAAAKAIEESKKRAKNGKKSFGKLFDRLKKRRGK